MTNFTDLKNVQIGIDRNGDRRFSGKVGDAEILETAFQESVSIICIMK